MPHANDLVVDKYEHGWISPGDTTAAELTVTKSGVAGRAHAVTKVDASYSSGAVSGLLTVTFNGITAKKYIHGSGALDFSADVGYLDATAGNDIVAVLANGGGGIVGTIVMSGYTTSPRPEDQ